MAFDFIGPETYVRASYTHGELFEWAAATGLPCPALSRIAAAYDAERSIEVSDPAELHQLWEEFLALRYAYEKKLGSGGEIHEVIRGAIFICEEALAVGGSFLMQR